MLHNLNNGFMRIMTLTFIFLAVFGVGKIDVRAGDFSDMLGEQPDGTYAGMGVTPGEEYEVPGHWDRTNIIYFDPEVKQITGEELTLSLSRPQDNPEDFVFSYTDASGNAVVTYSIDTYQFKEMYYPLKFGMRNGMNDLLWEDMYAYREPDSVDLAQDIRITYAIADMDISENGGSYTLDNVSFFKRGDTQFDGYPINDDYNSSKKRIQSYNIAKEFPEGETDGQVCYIVVEVWDPAFEGSRMTNAYEYTWVSQPEIVTTPPEYGPIEYFPTDNDNYAKEIAEERLFTFLLFVVPVIVVVVIIVIIVKVIKKHKRG